MLPDSAPFHLHTGRSHLSIQEPVNNLLNLLPRQTPALLISLTPGWGWGASLTLPLWGRLSLGVHRGYGDSRGGGTMTAPCGTRCSSGECACMCVCVCVCVRTHVPLRNAARAVWFPRQRCEGAQAATHAQRVRKTCHRSPGSQLEPGQLLPIWWSRTRRGWAAVELESGPGPGSIKPPLERAWLGQWG